MMDPTTDDVHTSIAGTIRIAVLLGVLGGLLIKLVGDYFG